MPKKTVPIVKASSTTKKADPVVKASSTTKKADLVVKASPTKDFFIHMLTVDLDLVEAIGDLIDNCIDGAKRQKAKSLSGYWAHIEANQKIFRLSDNCGGIPVDLARNHAFLFGRRKDTPDVEGSIGEFGIGMKRALFKMGNRFKVESKTKGSRFVVDQNVTKWLGLDEWELKFDPLEEDYRGDEVGTVIEVTELFRGVSDEFKLENFQTRLRNYLKDYQSKNIEDGFTIKLNDERIPSSELSLEFSEDMDPAHMTRHYTEDGKDVAVEIYTGLISAPQAKKEGYKKAGWYVYCNGRLILEADKDWTTGWDDGVPLFHPEYNRFRGYVFFDSMSPRVLPWTTTKSNVNTESALWQKVRLEMIALTRPVIDFLNKIKQERRC